MVGLEEAKKIMIGEIAKKFAEKVKPIYDLLDWTWFDNKTPPSIEEIEKTLISLTNDMHLEKGTSNVGTGGVYAHYEVPNEFNSCEEFGFRFILTAEVIVSEEGRSYYED